MFTKTKFVYLLPVFLLLGTYSFTAQVFPQSFTYNKIRHSFLDKSPEEGFCAGTLIKTPSSRQSIENLQVGDIVLDMYGNPTEILAITRRYVDGYIKIFLEDIVLCMGSDQLIYSYPKSSLIKACDQLTDTEHVDDPTIIYALTVQNHTFSISSCDFCAHNSAAIFSGASSICCGYVAVINPVIATLGGATLALAVVAYNAYQEYLEKYKDESLCLHDLPDTIVLAERFYYEQRKLALEKIKQELMAVKNDLQIIRGLYTGCFTHQLLQSHTYSMIKYVQPLSMAQEKQLSVDQKNTLRVLREAELLSLEKQICEIQFLLALHVNQLIDNLYHVYVSYDSATAEIQDAIAIWNDKGKALTPETALAVYKYDLLEEYLVPGVRQAFDELLLVSEYYRLCKSQCIQTSTTILLSLDKIIPVMQEQKRQILQQEERVRNNIAIAERYFSDRNISVMTFNNEVKKELDKQQKERDIEVLKKIEIEVCVNSFSGGPKKDDEEDDEYPFGKYEDAPYHTKISNSSKSKAPSNGQRALDNSISIGKNTSRRIGISEGEIVILDQTAPGLFHGHVRAWSDLTQIMKNVLTEANLVTLRGKIK